MKLIMLINNIKFFMLYNIMIVILKMKPYILRYSIQSKVNI